MEQPVQARDSLVRWIAITWFVLGLITATQVVIGMRAAGMPIRGWTLFWTTMVGWLWLAFAAPGILWLGRRFPVGKGNWRNLPLHVAVALGVSLVHAAWTAAMEWAFRPLQYPPGPYWRSFVTAMFSRFHTGLIVYAATLLISNTMDSVRRLAQREADSARMQGELSRAQLAALRRQLEPHFLFNTMNGIAGLVRESRNDEAVSMIARLTDLLRRVLNDSGRQLVPLGEEVEFLESYIGIQSMRFGNRLKVNMNVPRDLYGALVPPLILQPLVENAIVHGVSKRVDGGNICVSAKDENGILYMSVSNDGPSLNDHDLGVGISNTRGRLAKLYGRGYTFDLRNCREGGVEAVITVPWTLAP